METRVRAATLADAPEMTDILNALIRIGGTTANRVEYSRERFAEKYIHASNLISCFIAEAEDGEILGFQALHALPSNPDNWGDIATFAKHGASQRGIGKTLFDHTIKNAKALGLIALNATIRSYNTGGLAYYRKLGFEEYKRQPADPLDDGIPAEKIFHKRTV